MRISEIIDEALNRRGFLRGFGGAALGGAVGGAVGANVKDLHDLVAKKLKSKDEPDAHDGRVGLPQEIIDKHFKDRPTGGKQYMPPDRDQHDNRVSMPSEIWNKHAKSAENPNALKQRKYTNVGKNPNR